MKIPEINFFNIIKKHRFRTPNFRVVNNRRVIESLDAVDRANKDVRIKTCFGNESFFDNDKKFVTEIKMKYSDVPVAYNTFTIDKKVLNGGNMHVDRELRKRFGYGELLRLASIIDMNENNLDKLSIFALREAIPFHHKYKFQSNISFEKDCIQDLLVNISRQKNQKLTEFADCSRKLLEQFNSNYFGMNSQGEKKLLSEVNSLVENYLAVADKNRLPWESTIKQSGISFRTDIDMELTRDTIFRNRDFFNEKFENHFIDYKI